jgi:hypothetical protein
VLFRALPRRDVKPLAKALIAKFGSFAETIAAPPQRLAEVEGLGATTITDLKVIEAAARRLAHGEVKRRPIGERAAAAVAEPGAQAVLMSEIMRRRLRQAGPGPDCAAIFRHVRHPPGPSMRPIMDDCKDDTQRQQRGRGRGRGGRGRRGGKLSAGAARRSAEAANAGGPHSPSGHRLADAA